MIHQAGTAIKSGAVSTGVAIRIRSAVVNEISASSGASFGPSALFYSGSIKQSYQGFPEGIKFGLSRPNTYFGRRYFGHRYFSKPYNLAYVVPPQDATSDVYSTSLVGALGGSLTWNSSQIYDTSVVLATAKLAAQVTSDTIATQSSLATVAKASRPASALVASVSSAIVNSKLSTFVSTAVQSLSTTALTPLFTADGKSDIQVSTLLSAADRRIRYGESALASQSALSSLGGIIYNINSAINSSADVQPVARAARPGQAFISDIVSSLTSTASGRVSGTVAIGDTSSVTSQASLKASMFAVISNLSSVSCLSYLVARTLVPIDSISVIVSAAKRFRFSDTSIQDTSDITADAQVVPLGGPHTIYSISATSALGTGYRPGQSNQITASTTISSLAKLAAKTTSDILSISAIVSGPELWRYANISISSSTSVIVLTGATAKQAVSDTVLGTTSLVALAVGLRPGQSHNIDGTSTTLAAVTFTGRARTDVAPLSFLASTGIRVRYGTANIQDTASIAAESKVTYQASLTAVLAHSAIEAVGVGFRPGNVDYVPATSNIASLGTLIGGGYSALDATSQLVLLSKLYRAAAVLAQSSSSLDTLATGYRPAAAQSIPASSVIASFGKFIGKTNSILSSASQLVLSADLYRRSPVNITDISILTANGIATFLDTSQAIQTLSNISADGISTKPRSAEAMLGTSLVSPFGRFIGSGNSSAASLSSIFSQVHRTRPASSQLASSTLIISDGHGYKPVSSYEIQTASAINAVGKGYKPAGSFSILDTSHVGVAERFSAVARTQIVSSSFLGITVYRFAPVFSSVAATTQIGANAQGFKPDSTNLSSTSLITSLGKGYRPGQVNPVFPISTIVTAPRLIARPHAASATASLLSSTGQKYRPGISNLASTTLLTSLGKASKPATATLQSLAVVIASVKGRFRGQFSTLLATSTIFANSRIRATGKAANLAVSAVATVPYKIGSTTVPAFSTTLLTSLATGFRPAFSALQSTAVISALGKGKRPADTYSIQPLSVVLAAQKLTRRGTASAASLSVLSSSPLRYRSATSNISSLSAIIGLATALKPNFSDIPVSSAITAFARTAKPGPSSTLLAESYLGILQKIIARTRIGITSSSSAVSSALRYAPTRSDLIAVTQVVALAAGLKPNAADILSNSSLASLAKKYRPGVVGTLLPTSAVLSSPLLKAKTRSTLAAVSLMSSLGQKYRPGYSNLSSNSLVVSLALASKPASVSIQDVSIIVANAKARMKDRPPTIIPISTMLANARVRASGKSIILPNSIVSVLAYRTASIRLSVLSTTAITSLATGFRPASTDLQTNSVVSALGRGMRPGSLYPLQPTSVVATAAKLNRRGTTASASLSAILSAAVRYRAARSAMASLSSVISIASGQKPASSDAASSSAVTSLGRAYKPGHAQTMQPASAVSLAYRLIARPTAKPAPISDLSASADRVRPGRSALPVASIVSALGRGYRPASSNTMFALSLLALKEKRTARTSAPLSSSTAVFTSAKKTQKDALQVAGASHTAIVGNRIAKQYAYPYSISSVVTSSKKFTRSLSDVVSRTSGTAHAQRIARTGTAIDSSTALTAVPIYGSSGSGLALLSSALAILANARARYIDKSLMASHSLMQVDQKVVRRARVPVLSSTSVDSIATAMRSTPVYPSSVSKVASSAYRYRTATSYSLSTSSLTLNGVGRYRSRTDVATTSYLDSTGRKVRHGQSDLIRSMSNTASNGLATFSPRSSITVSSSIVARAIVKRQAFADIGTTTSVQTTPKAIFRDRIAIAVGSSTTEDPHARFKGVDRLTAISSLASSSTGDFIDSASINSISTFLNLRGNQTIRVNTGIISASDIMPRGSLIPGGVAALFDGTSQVTVNGRGRYRPRVAVAATGQLDASATRQRSVSLILQPNSAMAANGSRRALGASASATLSAIDAQQKLIRRSGVSIAQPTNVRVLFYKAYKPGQAGLDSHTSLTLTYKLSRTATAKLFPSTQVSASAGKSTFATTSASSRSRSVSIANRIAIGYSDAFGTSAIISNAKARVRPHTDISSITAVLTSAYRVKIIESDISSSSTVQVITDYTGRITSSLQVRSEIEAHAQAEFVSSADLNSLSNVRIRRTVRVRQASASIQINSNIVTVGRMSPPIDSASLLVGV